MANFEVTYLKLQNGSDIRGVALEGVEGETVNLTSEIACNIAAAFVDFLAEKKGLSNDDIKVGIGHDSRSVCRRFETRCYEWNTLSVEARLMTVD